MDTKTLEEIFKQLKIINTLIENNFESPDSFDDAIAFKLNELTEVVENAVSERLLEIWKAKFEW